jgi:sec-independent protein translocase protein TatB
VLGINGGEFLLLLVIALVVVGPERLPRYAEQLGGWVRRFRGFLGTAKDRVAEELGEEAADVDWASLDPRRYDPRRIVREALLDEPVKPVSTTGPRYTTGRGGGAAARATAAVAGAPDRRTPAAAAGDGAAPDRAPFDDEAT